MRTDVTVQTEGSIRCSEIPLLSPGRPSSVKRGDWVQWQIGTHDRVGRVIGFVSPPEEPEKVYLVVAHLMLGGAACENWVDPDLVVDTSIGDGLFQDKASWLFSKDFIRTSVDKARDCFNLHASELV